MSRVGDITKKKHTIKNAVITNALCCILFTSLCQDGGYQGYPPEGCTVIEPQKKPKGKELTAQQQQSNRQISRLRVRIEYAIGSIKRYRIVKDKCRLRKNRFVESVFRTCAGLHNLRLAINPWNYRTYST